MTVSAALVSAALQIGLVCYIAVAWWRNRSRRTSGQATPILDPAPRRWAVLLGLWWLGGMLALLLPPSTGIAHADKAPWAVAILVTDYLNGRARRRHPVVAVLAAIGILVVFLLASGELWDLNGGLGVLVSGAVEYALLARLWPTAAPRRSASA